VKWSYKIMRKKIIYGEEDNHQEDDNIMKK
jgi:hypothetical protein